MAKPQEIHAYIRKDLPTDSGTVTLVKVFNNPSTFAKEVAEWLGINDISHVYKAIKGKRKHAYRDPITGKSLMWWDMAKVTTVNTNSGQLTRGGDTILGGINISLMNNLSNTVDSQDDSSITSSATSQLSVTDNGNFTMVVFSDSHVIPNAPSLASKALVELIKQLQPKYVTCLGDTFDFATISKHSRSGWEKRFTVREELQAGCELLKNIGDAAPSAIKLMTFSNHDSRFNDALSAKIPEFEGVNGFNIKDHIKSDWKFGISIMLNKNTILKHQWHGGIHAAWNNVLKSGINIITGHTHKQGAKPYSDYTGTRYGVEVGTLSEINNRMYNYTEHSPLDWISGAAILTFKNGKLITPEFMSVVDGVAYFRGQPINFK